MKLYNGVIVPQTSEGIGVWLIMQTRDNSRLLATEDGKLIDFYSRDGRRNWGPLPGVGHAREIPYSGRTHSAIQLLSR